ncbi:MAG: hypothetical protein IT292_03480 [Deltaproteobacteria bacterium]|nr:hypothetical protein [Deltaproteobacteria bacterium]
MSEQKSLSQLIEKIIERGSLSREDQEKINEAANNGRFTNQDSDAVGRLTSLISEGRVNVLN